jgi:hypothetical protein
MSLAPAQSPTIAITLWRWDTINSILPSQDGFYMLSTLLTYQCPSVSGYLSDAHSQATSTIVRASNILFPAVLNMEFYTWFLTDNEQSVNHLSSLECSDQSKPDCPIRPLFQPGFFSHPK